MFNKYVSAIFFLLKRITRSMFETMLDFICDFYAVPRL